MPNVDGIRKLSGEELKRSRKMVLDYIGEEEKINEPKKNIINTKNIPKTMDGIMVSKKKISSKKKFSNKDFLDTLSAQGEDIEKENSEQKIANRQEMTEKKEAMEMEKKRIEIKKQKEEAERNIVNRKTKEAQQTDKEEIAKKEIKEKERRDNVKKQKEEELRLKKLAENKKNKLRISKLNNLKNRKRILRQAQNKKKRKEFKNKIIKKHKNWFNYFKDSFKKLTFKKISNYLLYLVLFIVSFTLLGYVVFSLVLLRVNSDCEFIKKVATYVPVPAVISKEGVITYKEYDEIYKDKSGSAVSEGFILERLAEKYNLKFDNDELILAKEILAERLAEDQEINRVSFMRVDDIRKAIFDGMKFSDVQEKYGDSQGVLDNDNFEYFKDDIDNLNTGDISDTISTKKGNYIIKKNDDNFEYLRVNNINLDEYLANEASKLKLWFLIK